MLSLPEHLRSLEEALFDPALRRDRAAVRDLLTQDFLEFGSSGHAWTRDQILDLLANETFSPVRVEEFQCTQLAGDVALVTYRAVRTGTSAPLATLRSSIWVKNEGVWLLRFHQGTRSG